MSTSSGQAPPRLQVEELSKVYRHSHTGGRLTRAVDGVSFCIGAREIYGLVGGSGSGKTTIARAVVGLHAPTSGRVRIEGRDVLRLRRRQLREVRRKVQMVSQDPFDALHPGMRVQELIAEPLVIHQVGDREQRKERVLCALQEVALTPPSTFLRRYPDELSGGQRQRVSIARAIVGEPILLVADEPTSMLDASVQLGVLDILVYLRAVRSLSALLITHDLAVARYVCDRVGVMRAGQLVEEGPAEKIVSSPQHQYTKALVHASGLESM